MTTPRYTPLIAALPATVPFVGPEQMERDRGAPFDARLGANENCFGPSPRAIAAMRDAAAGIWQYGDPTSHDLRMALARHHDTTPDTIVVGEGIDALLGYLCRLLIAPGDPVVTSLGGYPTFNYHVAGYGGTLHQVPYRNDAEDLPALIAKAAETGAKMVYFANPDNPMASYLTGTDIAAALGALPTDTLLVLDEAYIDFAPASAHLPIALHDPRVIRMRTFSKAYGMAGARVGYAIGHPALIQSFDKVRNHFGMNRAAQAGALAALADQAYLAQTIANVTAARARIGDITAAHGLTALPSATNFVAIDCHGDAAHARAILAALGQRGVFVRMPFQSPQDRCIRISAGRPADLDHLERALPDALAAARG